MNYNNPHTFLKVRSKAIMRAARDVPCQLRIASFIPGYNCSGDDTSVMAHPPSFGKGLSSKVSDLGTIIACSHCHNLLDMVDERYKYLIDHYPTAVQERITLGILATLQILVDKEVIVIPDAELII